MVPGIKRGNGQLKIKQGPVCVNPFCYKPADERAVLAPLASTLTSLGLGADVEIAKVLKRVGWTNDAGFNTPEPKQYQLSSAAAAAGGAAALGRGGRTTATAESSVDCYAEINALDEIAVRIRQLTSSARLAASLSSAAAASAGGGGGGGSGKRPVPRSNIKTSSSSRTGGREGGSRSRGGGQQKRPYEICEEESLAHAFSGGGGRVCWSPR